MNLLNEFFKNKNNNKEEGIICDFKNEKVIFLLPIYFKGNKILLIKKNNMKYNFLT